MPERKPHLLAAFAVLAAAQLAAPALAQDESLPGGASSLHEQHGDWVVNCAIRSQPDGKKAKTCALAQEQFHAKSRQRVLAIELRPEGDGVEGTLVLPFGLALDEGAVYQLDDGKPGGVQRFRTCLAVGCLIDVHFDRNIVASLKAGKTLKVKAVADGGKETVFSIPLDGFSSAYERVVALLE